MRENTTHREEFDIRQVEFGGSQRVKSEAFERGIKSMNCSCTHEAGLRFCVAVAPQGNLFSEKSA